VTSLCPLVLSFTYQSHPGTLVSLHDADSWFQITACTQHTTDDCTATASMHDPATMTIRRPRPPLHNPANKDVTDESEMSLKRSIVVKGVEKYAKRSYRNADPLLKLTEAFCFSVFRILRHKNRYPSHMIFRDVRLKHAVRLDLFRNGLYCRNRVRTAGFNPKRTTWTALHLFSEIYAQIQASVRLFLDIMIGHYCKET
jgi:hypothetical protein